MIRMGRGSRATEQPNETPQQQQQQQQQYQQQQSQTTSGNYYGYQQQQQQPEAAQAASRGGALTESEGIARDIKEGRLSGFVGAGTVLTGETNFQAMLRIDGHLTGRVISDNGTLIIGSGGQVDADIIVSSATIGGTVNGDIVATEKVELGRTARVLGNIQTPRLVIEDGAIFEGNCSMLKAKEAVEQRAEEARQAQYAATEYAAAAATGSGGNGYEEVVAGSSSSSSSTAEDSSEAAAS
ncbi:MAG: polymer-forming cytoskeletal protein [Acidobacteriota bacterium]|nr:polymer-forming cytoskeletal protein [Acidobacteriota bacterium]